MLKTQQHDVPGYERVVIGTDEAAGLHAVIAVYSTKLGPALGGVRMNAYETEQAAIGDALRLSKAMSYKAAAADLALGGGKAVIIGNPHTDKSRELFLALGDLIESLDGSYIAAEDIGLFAADLDIAHERTRHLTGTSPHNGGSGDCSGATALGVVLGIEAAARHRLDADDLAGLTVAIQGLGKVGQGVAALLHERGAKLIVADVVADRAHQTAERFNAAVADPTAIHSARADAFCPCALGGVLNDATIPQVRAAIVAGGANNQFADENNGPVQLAGQKILHAPDYIINAGGLIRLFALEIAGESSENPRIECIPARLADVFRGAEADGITPLAAANRLAEKSLTTHRV